MLLGGVLTDARRLGVDLLHQRAGRADRDRARAAAARARAGRGLRHGASTWPARSPSPRGLVLLVYALVGTNEHGWTSGRTLGLFAASAALLAAFVADRAPRAGSRCCRCGCSAAGTLTGANVVGLLLGVVDLLDVLLPVAVHAGGARLLAAAHRRRLPAGVDHDHHLGRRLAGAGDPDRARGRCWPRAWRCSALGTALVHARSRSTATTWSTSRPGSSWPASAWASRSCPTRSRRSAGVEERDAGVASGLINTSQQIGGAIGVAALVTVATTRTGDVLASAGRHAADPAVIASASTDGFQLAFLWGAGLAAIGVVATLALVRPRSAGRRVSRPSWRWARPATDDPRPPRACPLRGGQARGCTTASRDRQPTAHRRSTVRVGRCGRKRTTAPCQPSRSSSTSTATSSRPATTACAAWRTGWRCSVRPPTAAP